MKRILIGWMAALSALLCACSAQTVWETVDGGCVPAEGGAAAGDGGDEQPGSGEMEDAK